MSEEKTVYKKSLCEYEDVVAPDDLVQGDVETGGIYVDGAGEYKRGEVLMSNTTHQFIKATSAGMSSAYELCILAEDLTLDADTIADTTGYFFGEYKKDRIILPEGMTMTADVIAVLRKQGIYVR